LVTIQKLVQDSNKSSSKQTISIFSTKYSNVISGNNASNNGWGIKLTFGKNNTISGNHANTNTFNGISLILGDNNTITENIANNNNFWYEEYEYDYVLVNKPGSGIRIEGCDNNRIILNILSNNNIGISILDSKCNIISSNSFSGNILENIRGTQEECHPFPLEIVLSIVLSIVIPIVGIMLFITLIIIYKRKQKPRAEIKYPQKIKEKRF